MEQFAIKRLIDIHLGPIDLSFTNSALWMLIAVGCATLLMLNMGRARELVPGRWQTLAESLHDFVAGETQQVAAYGQEMAGFFDFDISF